MAEQKKQTKQNFLCMQSWMRIGMMVLMVIINKFTQMAINLVALVQAIMLLLKGEKHPQAAQIGQQLSEYSFDIMRFLTFNSDNRPFPFGGKSPLGSFKLPGKK